MIKNLIIATSEAKCEEIYAQIDSGDNHTVVRSGPMEPILINHNRSINSNHLDVFIFPDNGLSPYNDKLQFLPNAVFMEAPNGNVMKLRNRDGASGIVVCKLTQPFWTGSDTQLLDKYPIVTRAVMDIFRLHSYTADTRKVIAQSVFLELHFKEFTIENREELSNV